jgi:hypothetical protein
MEARNALGCTLGGDMACAGMVAKRVAAEMEARNALGCTLGGDMACTGVSVFPLLSPGKLQNCSRTDLRFVSTACNPEDLSRLELDGWGVTSLDDWIIREGGVRGIEFHGRGVPGSGHQERQAMARNSVYEVISVGVGWFELSVGYDRGSRLNIKRRQKNQITLLSDSM